MAEADPETYCCNVRSWGAEMPAFATEMGANRTLEERGRSFRSWQRQTLAISTAPA
jgi:hypothetical protein